MANNFLKVKKGLSTKPQTDAIVGAENGDLFYENSRGTHTVMASGQAMDLSSSTSVAGVASMTSAQMTAAALRSNVVTVTGAVGVTLHGMAAMQNGRQITIINATNQVMLIPSESGSEGTPANRIHTAGAVTISVVSGGAITIVRDGPTGRWRAAFPTTPVTAKDSGVFTWNINGVTPAYTSVISDGFRVIPPNKAITVYGYSISQNSGLISGWGSLSVTMSYMNGTVWTTMTGFPTTLVNGIFTNGALSQNFSANVSGNGNPNNGILFRAWIDSQALSGITSTDVTIQLFWREQ